MALSNQWRLICHKNPTNQKKVLVLKCVSKHEPNFLIPS